MLSAPEGVGKADKTAGSAPADYTAAGSPAAAELGNFAADNSAAAEPGSFAVGSPAAAESGNSAADSSAVAYPRLEPADPAVRFAAVRARFEVCFGCYIRLP